MLAETGFFAPSGALAGHSGCTSLTSTMWHTLSVIQVTPSLGLDFFLPGLKAILDAIYVGSQGFAPPQTPLLNTWALLDSPLCAKSNLFVTAVTVSEALGRRLLLHCLVFSVVSTLCRATIASLLLQAVSSSTHCGRARCIYQQHDLFIAMRFGPFLGPTSHGRAYLLFAYAKMCPCPQMCLL